MEIEAGGDNSLLMRPIGTVYSPYLRRIEAPHQGTAVSDTDGGEPPVATFVLAEWLPEEVFSDLEGFERVWLIFLFHQSQGWRSMLKPPRGSSKRGLFATRSPHRPNRIGITAARLIRVDGRTLYLQGVDLLNGTPVLDIKPYSPTADAFPDAKAGWVDQIDAKSGRNRSPGLKKPLN